MLALATAILVVHLGVVVFNVGGLLAIPLGGWLGWRWVRGYWWRLAHVLSLAVVAVQGLFGRACFLTIWQFALTNDAGTAAPPPLIAAWINRLLYWPLPHWVFVAAYVVVFFGTLLLWRWVPPVRRQRDRSTAVFTTR
ncbi:MAG TPA: DUF2784 family protein [Alphaproteobacteria bacterium]